jgi:hypothetical protein
MMAAAKACPALLNYVYFDHWKSKVEKIDRHAGGAFARGGEVSRRAYYELGLSAENSIEAGVKALLEFYGDVECPPTNPKTPDRMAGALRFYFERYPLNHLVGYPILMPGGKRAIEVSFVVPLAINHPVTGQPLLYCGRMDTILQTLGAVFGEDDKTTKSLGRTWPDQWSLRAQLIGYKWGARSYGIDLAGMVVRGVSILKTQYDTVEAVHYYPDWLVDQWESELLEWLTDVIGWWGRKSFRHNMDSSCSSYGGCGFLTVCTRPPDTRSKWLSTFFERRHWNPITREETPL